MRSAFGQVPSARLNAQRNIGSSGSDEPIKPTKNPRWRQSLGGAISTGRGPRGSMTNSKMGMGRRQSMAPQSTRRQSSVAPPRGRQSMSSRRMTMGGGSLKNDPRPLGEKGFIHQEIRNLIRFLADHNYDYAVSPKMLLRPTGKDFQQILQFLFGHVDRNFRFGAKFIDEVPTMFKGLCYPFNISKTALSAVGSPHTWPALLASLTWLIELLEYDEQRLDMEYQSENTTGDDAASDEDKMFFRYLRDAYQCFLCGDDERYEELDEELVRVYRDRQEDIRAQTAQVLESHAELTAQVDELTNRNSVLPELEANKRDYAEDLVKFRQLIERLVEHKDALESKGREYAQEVSERKAELDVAERARDRVKARLELQEVSPADAERMHMEKRRLEEAIAQVLKDRESAQQSKWELEMELSRKVEDLEACIKTYNAAATRLKLVPLNAAANTQGVEFELRLDMASYFRGSSVLSGDSIKDAIRPALRELQEIAIRKTHEARARSMEVKAQVDRNEEERTEYTERIAQLNAKLSKSADQYSHEKEMLDRQLQRMAVETEGVENSILALRNSTGADVRFETAQREIAHLEALITEEHARFSTEELAMEDHIHQCLDLLVEHKQAMEETLADAHADLAKEAELALSARTSSVQQIHLLCGM